jgi:hypothetical protein
MKNWQVGISIYFFGDFDVWGFIGALNDRSFLARKKI